MSAYFGVPKRDEPVAAGRLLAMLMFRGRDDQVSAVRAYVGRLCAWHPRRDDLLLVLSEVVTNALRHTRSGRDGTIILIVTGVEGAVRCEVIDQGGATEPTPVETAPSDGESGHGLRLVGSLAARWGATPHGEGTKTWFEI